ncbi:unnamed protein product [Darwinula stevensoni]|uniref:RRM domain-containing protein n=1 Tax=Darwinula stevensoni TaxID=69355 RepID=A0A7R9A0I4_9CRUS|nr:unnamed protein product [Darwinula stevensoni]CAG0884689.1 unnamed protein product [Darwinula stevensoni]
MRPVISLIETGHRGHRDWAGVTGESESGRPVTFGTRRRTSDAMRGTEGKSWRLRGKGKVRPHHKRKDFRLKTNINPSDLPGLVKGATNRKSRIRYDDDRLSEAHPDDVKDSKQFSIRKSAETDLELPSPSAGSHASNGPQQSQGQHEQESPQHVQKHQASSSEGGVLQLFRENGFLMLHFLNLNREAKYASKTVTLVIEGSAPVNVDDVKAAFPDLEFLVNTCIDDLRPPKNCTMVRLIFKSEEDVAEILSREDLPFIASREVKVQKMNNTITPPRSHRMDPYQLQVSNLPEDVTRSNLKTLFPEAVKFRKQLQLPRHANLLYTTMYDAMADFVRGESLFVSGWPALVTFSPFRYVNVKKILMESGKQASVNLAQINHNPFKSKDYEELKKIESAGADVATTRGETDGTDDLLLNFRLPLLR